MSLVGFVVLAALAAAACEQVPLLAPSASTITVSAPVGALPAGGSTSITAFVGESSGTPVQNGTLVRFTATLGRVDPAEVETRGGTATTTFIAGNSSGMAQIRATSGGATGGTPAAPALPANVVEIAIGGAAAAGVTVTANPSRVPASGGTVTITASALDASGNRLIGVPISFTTDQGTLSASTATTDASGEARVTLTTNRAAKVTARVGGGGTAQTATVDVSVGTATSITLATSPTAPQAGSPVTLNIKPAAGTTPRVVVAWGDGRSDDLGIVTAERNATHVYAASGAYTITATATGDGDTFATSTSVTVSSGAAITLSTPASVVAGSPITLTVTPPTGSAPRVVMDWGDGTTSDLGVVTAARGVTHTYSAAGSYAITATATAGTDTFTTSTAVTITARPPVSLNVTGSPSQPDRCAPVTFTATTTESISSYLWTIDSNVDSEDATVTTTGNTLTRAFAESGTKTVSVTATTADGRTGNGQTQVVVKTTPPACL